MNEEEIKEELQDDGFQEKRVKTKEDWLDILHEEEKLASKGNNKVDIIKLLEFVYNCKDYYTYGSVIAKYFNTRVGGINGALSGFAKRIKKLKDIEPQTTTWGSERTWNFAFKTDPKFSKPGFFPFVLRSELIEAMEEYLGYKSKQLTEEERELERFKNYYFEYIQDEKNKQKIEENIKNRKDFVEEYPIERIKTLALDEYILGKQNKEAFIHKLEMGKYAYTGLSIKGGTAGKLGIYFSKNDGVYKDDKRKPIENPEEYWLEFREQLYNYLVELKNIDVFPNMEKYPMLSKIPILLVKLSYLYYPNNFVNLGKKEWQEEIFNKFNIEDFSNILAENSFNLYKFIDKNLPELLERDTDWIGNSLSCFIKLELNNKDIDDNSENNNINDENNIDSIEKENSSLKLNLELETYTKEDFKREVYISDEKYNSMCSILERKKNIILTGPPGVGKTFMAKRLVYSIMGVKDNSKIEMIQFHQSYSYEEFIEGYRPTENGSFELKKGLLYNFAKKAESDLNNNYYLIIDEINRGNLSKIFGELLMLIEVDKRGSFLKLAYSNDDFTIPENLYIIGLMNTADRSLAIIDYALRRRFSFINIQPAFDNEKFKKQFEETFDIPYVEIYSLINDLNNEIKEDPSLGEGFMIGHSYFCLNKEDNKKGTYKDIKEILQYEIIPLIQEYWYDDYETLGKWIDRINNYIENKGIIND